MATQVNPEDLRRFVLGLPQIVPESWCFECRICCRFPDTEKVQTPFWAPLEAAWAKESSPEAAGWFKPEEGSPSLSPRLVSCGGAGYRCPAFEPETNRCSIHAVKPLDCRLYPFVLAHNPGGTEVLLAMDTKCPFIESRQEDPKLSAYADRLAAYLDTETGMEYLRKNPKVVGPSWPEYLWVAALPRATSWIQPGPSAVPPHPALRPVQPEDLPLLRRALEARVHTASHYTAASLLGWSDLIRLWWAPQEEGMSLFAEQAGGWFMPVPPLGAGLREDQVQSSWEILKEINQGGGVSRIEGIEPSDVPLFERMGFSVSEGEAEYLYSAPVLARLQGEGYRSQRWAINRCAKAVPFRVRPFEEKDVVPSLQLYTRWAIHRQRKASGDMERKLLRDSLFFHRRIMVDRDRFGLVGRVLESEGTVRAYTFGGAVSSDTFCVFAEIAERSPAGLAPTLFREICLKAEKMGCRQINAMGDAGLPSLHRAKRAYRPASELPVFTAVVK